MQSSQQGYLYSWIDEEGPITRSLLLNCDRLRFLSSIIDGDANRETGWEKFHFSSSSPLLGEVRGQGDYRYEILCRRSGQRVLLLAKEREIIEDLVAKYLTRIFVPNLRPVSIRIGDLVSLLVNKPTNYSLTRVYARVPGFGTSLNAISFYGDDLANAKMFRDTLPAINCTTCGLAELGGRGEVVIVGTNGRVTFAMGGVERLDEVERALGYLSRSGLIDD